MIKLKERDIKFIKENMSAVFQETIFSAKTMRECLSKFDWWILINLPTGKPTEKITATSEESHNKYMTTFIKITKAPAFAGAFFWRKFRA